MSTRFPAARYPADLAIAWHEQKPVQRFLKRLLDIVLSVALLILLTPIMVVIALLVRLDSPGPAIFRQQRVGKLKEQVGGSQSTSGAGAGSTTLSTFTFYKFRSMQVDSDDTSHRQFVERFINGKVQAEDNGPSPIYKLASDKRVTRVGRVIRATSLDELPQLFNVLKGDMSLVGPRPPLPYEVAMYKASSLRRLKATPGITGLWQVHGRSKVTFDEMIGMDLEYADNWSLWLDLKILMLTLPAVMRQDGAA